MKTFLVSVHDHIVRTFEKTFEAETENEARIQAEAEEYTTKNGWDERYEDLFSEQYIESIIEVDE